MATKYFALLTNIGAAKLANATALGAQVEITQMAVGDGNGVLPTPNPAQTALVHELRRAQLNMLTVDPVNTNQIIAEQVIPEDAGGWWIREIGLFDKDGDMVAIANCAETYKPQLQEGSGRVQVIRVILIVSSTEAVTLKIDPAVVLATRQYVDSQLRAHERSRNHPDASTTEKGFVQLSSSVISDSESQAATPKAVKIAMDNGSARLAKDRNLSDLPNTALARQNLELGDSSTRNVGTTAGTVASGDDARITGAMQKSQNGGDIPDVERFLQNLGALATSGGTVTGNLNIKGETKTDGNISTAASVLAAYRLAIGSDVLNPVVYIDDQGNLYSYKWHNQNLFDDVSRRIIGESAVQAGFSNGDFSKPYMMHSNGKSVFLVTSAMAGIGIPMIGMPFYWPIDKMPNLIFPELSGMSFAKMNGASFSASLFPNLAKVFPNLVLPDTRGEFIRVWDDGRGVDPMRDMLSYQSDSTKSHTHRFLGSNGSVGNSNVLGTLSNTGDTFTYGINQPDGSTKMFLESTGGSETRPRNIAFSFIVRIA